MGQADELSFVCKWMNFLGELCNEHVINERIPHNSHLISNKFRRLFFPQFDKWPRNDSYWKLRWYLIRSLPNITQTKWLKHVHRGAGLNSRCKSPFFFFFFLNFWIFGGWKSHAHWHSSQMHTNTYDFIIWANCIKIDFIYDDFDRENSVSTFKSIELISFTNATTILLTSIDAMRVTIECCTIECCELLSVSVRLCNSRSRTKKKINMIC